jgi:hypothetical protein
MIGECGLAVVIALLQMLPQQVYAGSMKSLIEHNRFAERDFCSESPNNHPVQNRDGWPALEGRILKFWIIIR